MCLRELAGDSPGMATTRRGDTRDGSFQTKPSGSQFFAADEILCGSEA
ncbi:hypothetical protein PI125_g20273 [Phytophthora idaei]|nr:hypothetical protein PI125_g20273 [Phytophthora idaei]